jgi:hypothetical protein
MRTAKHVVVMTLGLLALAGGPAAAVRILENFSLEAGRVDKNRIAAPVWDAAGVAPVAVEKLAWKPGPDYQVIRRLTMRVPQFTVSPAVNLGAQLSIALQTEGTSLGLRMSAPGTDGWTVSGSIEDLWLETRPVIYGPLLFYAYMDVALTVRRGDGAPQAARYRLHNMYARVNGGFGVQDEVAEALAQFLIESGQEIAARLNRDFFQAPPHPSLRLEAESLAAGPLDDREAQLRRIGLSGSKEAVPVLLGLLTKEPEEGNRVYVLDALASLGSADAVRPLADRYDGEDEDCRFFILKAWDYIGGEEARSLIARKGPKDKDVACRALAERLKD